jgi:hypothetical protein
MTQSGVDDQQLYAVFFLTVSVTSEFTFWIQ